MKCPKCKRAFSLNSFINFYCHQCHSFSKISKHKSNHLNWFSILVVVPLLLSFEELYETMVIDSFALILGVGISLGLLYIFKGDYRIEENSSQNKRIFFEKFYRVYYGLIGIHLSLSGIVIFNFHQDLIFLSIVLISTLVGVTYLLDKVKKAMVIQGEI